MITARAMRKEGRRNRKFQEKMSSTAYRRGIKDLRKAGMNPLLVSQFGGASSPAGNMANVPDWTQPVRDAMQGAQTAADVANKKEQNKNIVANTAKTEADTVLVNQDVMLRQMNMPRAKATESFDRNVVTPLLKKAEDWVGSARSSYRQTVKPNYKTPAQQGRDKRARDNARQRSYRNAQ